MSETTAMAQPTDEPGAAHPAGPSRLNQALAWVGIVAGGLFVVGAIFFSGYFLNWSQHAHMGMAHAAMSHESKDCCADMKHGGMGHDMMGPHAGN